MRNSYQGVKSTNLLYIRQLSQRLGRYGVVCPAVVDVGKFRPKRSHQHLPATPILTWQEAARRLQRAQQQGKVAMFAFYSSVLGGIVRDPGLMAVHIDDHMVHRGHGVFDTAFVVNGHVYELDSHLDRLERSAAMARIPLPMSREAMKRIILETAAAGMRQQGYLRFWLSAGRGGFQLGPAECPTSSFYVVCMDMPHTIGDIPRGPIEVRSTTVPPKQGDYARMKQVGYLQNVHCLMEAEDAGCSQGVWVAQDGTVLEASNANVAIITQNKDLVIGSFNECLAGCTAARALKIMPKILEETGSQLRVESFLTISQRTLKQEDVFAATEAMLLGSGAAFVQCIGLWDGQVIGDGEIGAGARDLQTILRRDYLDLGSDVHHKVPYGGLTGMVSPNGFQAKQG